MSLNSPSTTTADYSSSRPFSNPTSNVGTRFELLEQISEMGLSGDQEEPIKIEFDDIAAASFRIRGSVIKTPCEKTHIPDLSNMEVFFKKEFLQHTGSFKERGALNTLHLLSEEQQLRGIVAASAGNHALALAYHGFSLNIPVTVIMPENAPLVKISLCKKYGATVKTRGHNISDILMTRSNQRLKEYVRQWSKIFLLEK